MNKHSIKKNLSRTKKRHFQHQITRKQNMVIFENKQTFNKQKQQTKDIITNSAIINGIAIPISLYISPNYPICAYALILTIYCIFLAIKNNFSKQLS